ncbi:MAG: phosphatase PAP2 family protein [Armatimonadetes bacterium]|nr:phosphatase PAP2 family protein [Armatimonadota bacterium]
MQLFLFLNDLAGRWPLLDGAMRFFYVGAVPAMATLLLAQLLLFPRREDAAPRARIVFAVAFALLLAAFLALVFEYLAQVLNLGNVSPRPFMTRRVNLLVLEPQDNSFPCYEIAIAAILAVALGFSSRKWGVFGAFLVILLGVARMFCGTNYFADVAVGALLGAGAAALCGAMFEARWRIFSSQPALHFAGAAAILALTLGATYVSLAATPRFASKLPAFWNAPATAAPSASEAPLQATRAARAVLQEGEGLAEATVPLSAEELALSKRSHQFLPEVERFLRGKLAPLARPFRLLDVEVAPVRAGGTAYRAAALRFEISREVPDLRRQTAEVAARLVKAAFASDSQLQNVDVTAILRGDAAQIDGSVLRFAGDEVPVFTASIARQSLVVASPRWVNDPKLDGGSWLRARSRLYINERILPPLPKPLAAPVATPKPLNPTLLPKTPVGGAIVIPKEAVRLKPQTQF